jgi:Cu(I)/Ag(I) efflux system membrane protein CusA/SilA
MFTHLGHFEFRPKWLARAASHMLKGRIHPEEKHPVSRALIKVYDPVVSWALRWKWGVIAGAVAATVATVPVFNRLGAEFMPPLDEEALFYMPSTMPGISIGEAQKLLQVTDRIIKGFPEVEKVMGKAGRRTSPTPLSMLETVILLKPKDQWRKVDTWYASWAPEPLKKVFRHVTPDHISRDALVNELNDAVKIPGVSNAWTMPIKARIDMLTTGVRTPIGLKISGADLNVIGEIGARVEAVLPSVKGTRSVFAERTGDGFFLDIVWNREALSRYGLSIDDAQTVVQNAIGGDTVTTVLKGRERYPVNVRYKRDFRSDVAASTASWSPRRRASRSPLGAGDGGRRDPP